MRAELLAPAGTYESLKAAVAAGADAVYAGGARFGARAYAENFTEEALLKAIDFCHLHGSKLYLTVNTLLKDAEIEELYDYLLPYYREGLDAVIVQDIGVLKYIREAFPGLDIHASTQMTLCGADGAKFLESLGASRIVTSRELSLEEIRAIHRETSIEIESFVHGALCYCYSGQCLTSSLIGGRSGNRGRCAQPCRLPYQAEGREGFLLSPKDICTLEILPEILDAGVYSLKIEGRMKRAEYTAGVVRIYRKYLDIVLAHGRKEYQVSEYDKKELMALYNRGGFSTGYYEMRNGREMMSMKRANHFGTEAARVTAVRRGSLTVRALEPLHKGDMLENTVLSGDTAQGASLSLKLPESELRGIKPGMILHRTRDEFLLAELNRKYIQTERKEKINGKLMISGGQPVILNVIMGKISISAKGEVPQVSQNRPLSALAVKKQIEKTGNTPFVFEHLEIHLEDGLFLPLQCLNELRRRALDELERKLTGVWKRNNAGKKPHIKLPHNAERAAHRLNASVETTAQLEALCKVPGISNIYIECTILETPLRTEQAEKWAGLCHAAGKSCYYVLPRIFRSDTKALYSGHESLKALELFDGVLFRNYEEFFFLQKYGYTKARIPDYNMYTYNRYAEEFWKERGIAQTTAPLELNDRELAVRGCKNSEILVYGHLPMMVSAQCVRKNVDKCRKQSGFLYLKDRKGKRFPVKNSCSFCYNVIYNHVPLALFGNKKELDALAPASLRLSFTIEPPEKAAGIAQAFAEKFVEVRNIEYDFGDFTRGHFKRGVE
ncbi:MAG: U32 family peptidase [Lachnospiraceae bacterium]|jgi:putative protease|nr:U32 family peptidase [Lachnospiraceae bacterium]MCI9660447.1 U32 family peptidase [Lachnospiraceae bacterium]